jgi:hypothetical protein
MALSQDEQRVLAEIERRLVAEDPRLASSLSTFRRPGPGSVLRSPRARIIGSLFTVLLVAMVSLMVYAMIPFRAHGARTTASPSAVQHTTISATQTTRQQDVTQPATGAAVVAGGTSPGAPTSSAAPSSRVPSPRAHGSASSQATGRSTPSTGP